MPSFDIVRKTTPSESFRVNAVRGMFGLQEKEIQEHFSGTFALPDKWRTTNIARSSQLGKTSSYGGIVSNNHITFSFEYL